MPTQNAINANAPGIVGYDGAGSFVGSSLTTNAVVYAGSATTLVSQALTNGQLQIGNTGNPPTASTLTAGTGISITNASGSITIAGTGGGLTWTVVTGTTQAMVNNNGYFANNAGTVVFTMPPTAAVGTVVTVSGMNNNTGWQIVLNTGQQIFFGISATTITTGSLASTRTNDSVYMVCNVANTSWIVQNSVGNITVL